MIFVRHARSSSNILFLDLKIECTFHQLRREQRQASMVEPQRKTLGDFALPDITENSGGIIAPTIAINNFEINPSVI